MKYYIAVFGKTYEFRDVFKQLGFKWDRLFRNWYKIFNSIDEMLDMLETIFDIISVEKLVFYWRQKPYEHAFDHYFVFDESGNVIEEITFENDRIVVKSRIREAYISTPLPDTNTMTLNLTS